MDEQLILVNDDDMQTGTAGKTEVHEKGLLHRAFSVFIFNDKGNLLLQQRSTNKYHSAGLWTNTCCGHPLNGKIIENEAVRRLDQEMKIKTSLNYICSFQYKTVFQNGLIENEIDHVYYGISNQLPSPDPAEVKNWKYESPEFLIEDVNRNPKLYTSWLKICIDRNIFGDLLKIKNK